MRTQCFPLTNSEAFKRWRYVVTCYGQTEEYEETPMTDTNTDPGAIAREAAR